MSLAVYKQPVSVLVVVATRQGQVLLLRRADAGRMWQSVTGSLEYGETPMQTARRELREETGIDMQRQAVTLVDRNIEVEYDIYPHLLAKYAPGTQRNREHWFVAWLAHTQAVQLSPGEHSDFCWCHWQTALERVTSPSNRQAIEQLFSDDTSRS